MGRWLAVAVVVLVGCGGASKHDACAAVMEAACTRFESCQPQNGTAADCARSLTRSGTFCVGEAYVGSIRDWTRVEACLTEVTSTSCAEVALNGISVQCLVQAVQP